MCTWGKNKTKPGTSMFILILRKLKKSVFCMQPTGQSLYSKGHSANPADSLTLLLQPVFHYGQICCNLILIDDLAGVSRPRSCRGHLSASSLPGAP